MSSELGKSYELIGRVFEKLVKAGLRKVELASEDVGVDESDPLFEDVVNFLLDEGFIRSGGQELEGLFFNVQLTSRGLAAIDSERFGDGQTVRSELERKGEVSSATYGKIGSFIGGMLAGGAKALGG